MQGKTHLTVGLAAGLAVAAPTATGWGALAVAAGVGGLAALLPDWLQINLPGVNRVIKGVTGHRGFSHWLWTGAALTWLLLWPLGGWPLAAPFAAGYGSHLLLDALAGGVPLLWPWRVTLARLKTGGRGDLWFGAAGLLIAVVLAAARL